MCVCSLPHHIYEHLLRLEYIYALCVSQLAFLRHRGSVSRLLFSIIYVAVSLSLSLSVRLRATTTREERA